MKRTVDPDVINLCDDTDDEAPPHTLRKTNGEAQKAVVVKTKVKEGVIEILSSDEEDLSPAQISGKFWSPDPACFSHPSPPTTNPQTISSPTPTIAKSAAKVPANESSPLEFPPTTPSPPTYNDIEMDDAFEFRSPEGSLEDSQMSQFRSPTQSPLMPECTLSPTKAHISLPRGCIPSPPHSSAQPCDDVIQSSVSVRPAASGSQTASIGSLPANPSPTSRFREWGPSQADKGPFKNMHKSLDLSRRAQKETSLNEKPTNLPSPSQSSPNSKVGETLPQTSVQTIGPNAAIVDPPSHTDLSIGESVLPQRKTADMPLHDQPPTPLTQALSKSAGISEWKPASSIRPVPSVPRRKVDAALLPALSTPLSQKDGKSLSDVIEEAYRKPSPAIVDLTLDNSDEDEAPALLVTLQQSADSLWRLLEKDSLDLQPSQQRKSIPGQLKFSVYMSFLHISYYSE